jgi:parallel beta-helix repeat protein
MFGTPTVDILKENVTVCGFVIQHHSSILNEYDYGVVPYWQCNVSGNLIRGNVEGITGGTWCNYNVIADNIIQDNGVGLRVGGVWNNITNNIIRDNWDGTEFHNSHTLINNTIFNNTQFGLQLSIWNSTLRNNTMISNGYNFIMRESLLPLQIDDIDTSNTVNGKPIYYWINQSDKTVPSDAGYIAIINSTNITVDSLSLEHNGQGILISYSSNIAVKNCNLADNWWGVRLKYSSNVTLHHNNFVNNFYQYETIGLHSWDDGYPSGGNYWSNYNGADTFSGAYQNETGSDGIADQLFSIVDEEFRFNNSDRYPLMAPVSIFDVGEWNGTQCKVHVVSNSTVSNFQLNTTEQTIRFNVTGEAGLGFSRVTIPSPITQTLWQNNWTVLVDNQPPIEIRNWTDTGNTYIYFIYEFSEHQVMIIPEFLSTTILLSTLLLAPFILIIHKKQSSKRKTTTGNSR